MAGSCPPEKMNMSCWGYGVGVDGDEGVMAPF